MTTITKTCEAVLTGWRFDTYRVHVDGSYLFMLGDILYTPEGSLDEISVGQVWAVMPLVHAQHLNPPPPTQDGPFDVQYPLMVTAESGGVEEWTSHEDDVDVALDAYVTDDTPGEWYTLGVIQVGPVTMPVGAALPVEPPEQCELRLALPTRPRLAVAR